MDTIYNESNSSELKGINSDSVDTFRNIKRRSRLLNGISNTIKVIGFLIVSSIPFFACSTSKNPLEPIDPTPPEIFFNRIPTELQVGTADSALFVVNQNDYSIYSVSATVNDRFPDYYLCVCEQDGDVSGILKWNVQPSDTGLTVLKITAETDAGTIEKEHFVQATWTLETLQSGTTSILDTVAVRITDTENFYINLRSDTIQTDKAIVSIMDPITSEVASLSIKEGNSRIIYTIVLEDETLKFALKIDEIGLDYIKWSLDIIKE